MGSKLTLAMAVLFFSSSAIAQVQPAARKFPLNFSAGGGANYWSGDWGTGDINRWGATGWATVSVWSGFKIIAESHSMLAGGNTLASHYKYVTAGGGVEYVSDYWGRLQPFAKAEAGFGSLTHPDNASGHFHDTGNIWTLGGGMEYHTWGHLWTRVEYSYDYFPNFHSSITGENHTLNPRGITFGEVYRFGEAGKHF
jgi:hypothetical protein